MRRILVWFWSGGGGGSQFAARLAHRLTKRFGADAVALSMRADDPTIASAEARGVRVLKADVVSDRRRPLQTLMQLARGRSVLREHIATANADVVCLAMNFAAAAPLSFTLNKPLVYCAHDPEPHPGDFAATAQRLTQGPLLRRAETIVALSDYAASRLALQSATHGKVRAAPLSSVFEPAPNPAPMPVGPARFLLIGRMIAYKGLELLLDALPQLADRDDWRLSIVGRGPALDDETQRALSRFTQVEVRDTWLTEAEIDALIDAHHIVLAPYTEASQSGVVSQALARGRPLIATAVGALGEQLGAGAAAWLAEANAHAFAQRMITAIEDLPGRTARAEAAIQLARTAWDGPHWDWLGAD